MDPRLARVESLIRQLQGALGGNRFVRGYISSAGAVIAGEGFSVSGPAGAIFTVSFDTAFAGAPVVVVGSGSTSGAFDAKIANGTTPTTTGFQVVTFNTTTGSGAAAAWSFVAMGPLSA